MDKETLAALKLALEEMQLFDAAGRFCAEGEELIDYGVEDWTREEAEELTSLLSTVSDVSMVFKRLEAACNQVTGAEQ